MSTNTSNSIPSNEIIPSSILDSNNESISISNQDDKSFSENNNNSNFTPTQLEEIDGYLFDIYEEDNFLFLFLKVFNEDKYTTICVQIEEPRYYLYFYPTEKDKKDSLVDEVRELAQKCGGYFIEPKNQNLYQTKFYAFDNDTVPVEGEWLCASFSRNCDLTKIPPTGFNYQFVFGISNRLIDCFRTHNLIKGPQWVHIKKLQIVTENQYTSTFTYKVKNPKRITPLVNNENKKIPTFNICSMALRYIHDTESGEDHILMISAKIRDQCDIENYKSSKRKVTFLNSDHDVSTSIDNVITCNNETQLLELFFETIQECEIDLICSYNLTDEIRMIKNRMTALNIDDKCKIGRMYFIPATETTPVHHPRGGRLLCDLRSMCDEFIKSVSSSFNYIVAQEFDNFYRQPLEQVDIVTEIKKIPKLINLIRYNIRDTSFTDALIKKINLLPLTLQLSQLSGCQWSKILRGYSKGGGPSSRCESLFVFTFSELGFIIPEKYNSGSSILQDTENTEDNENARKRIQQYKGGLVLPPKTGFYDNCVLVLDFNSLYPSIIREYNLCFTTIGHERPENDESRHVLANTKTKNANPGVLQSIMANLLEARSKVKEELTIVEKHVSHVEESKENLDKSYLLKEKRLKIQQAAIKILANAMYGYLGFQHSRFPAVHIAEMVTFLGREILESTAQSITNMGHNVVYGDTDSVMIQTKTKDWKEAISLAEEIGKKISSQYKYLKLGVESIFMKFLLLTKKKYAALIFEKGETMPNFDEENYTKELPKHTWLKIKGLEIIRRDWCPLSKYLSNYALKCFMYTNSQSDASTKILNEIQRISSMLINDGQPLSSQKVVQKDDVVENVKLEITVDDLVINKGITKSLDQYKPTDKTFNVNVGRWMENNGYHVKANDVIPYIVIDDAAKEADKRAKHPSIVYSVCEADIEWYLTNQLLPPLLRLCEPFQTPQQEAIEKSFGLLVKNPTAKLRKYLLSPSARSTMKSIPQHKVLSDLFFICPSCNKECLVKNLLSKSVSSNSILCPSCAVNFAWKSAFNLIVCFVRDKIEKWQRSFVSCDCGYVSEVGRLPICCVHENIHGRKCSKKIRREINNSDILRTLKSFHKLFSDVNPGENEELAFLCENMSYYLLNLISMHGLNRIQLKSIISVQPFNSQSSD